MPRPNTLSKRAGRASGTSAAGTRQRADVEPVALRIARELLALVKSGEFKQGERLPTEQALAERFRISRPSLREALSALQFAGYLESRQGYGTVVVELGGEPRARQSRSGQLPDPLDVLEARLALEPIAAQIAARDPDPDALQEARSMLDGMWLVVDGAGQLGIDTDIALHISITKICRNGPVRDSCIHLLKQVNPPKWRDGRTALWADPTVVRQWAIEHEATMSAITRGQADRAALCVRHHLLSTGAGILGRSQLEDGDRARLQQLLNDYSLRSPLDAPRADVKGS